jgi:hypothetical protein
MLGNPFNFNEDETEDLFGKSFVNEMVKSPDTVNKLASWGQPDHDGGSNRLTEQQRNNNASGSGLNPGGYGPCYNGATPSYRGRGSFNRTKGSQGGSEDPPIKTRRNNCNYFF